MIIYSTYKVKIKNCNKIFKDTARIYRKAVDYLIKVVDCNWSIIYAEKGSRRLNVVEALIHKTDSNPNPQYDFDEKFYKFPSYIRRGAINEAIGRISSYRTILEKWESNPKGKRPSFPSVGSTCPCMYKQEMYRKAGKYQARLKVFIRNTWVQSREITRMSRSSPSASTNTLMSIMSRKRGSLSTRMPSITTTSCGPMGTVSSRREQVR